MRISVLGAGMVGRTIAIDLSRKHEVTSFDLSLTNLDLIPNDWNIQKIERDLTDFNYEHVFTQCDLVISAVPGWMGFKTLEAVIKQKKDVVDISFFPEDPFLLFDLAKQNGVTAIVDCGVAPGMSNMILGYYNSKMKIESFSCMVGGLPKVRIKPFEYKAPFSPIDVLEEYTRPARFVENGHEVVKPALSDIEHINFPKVGTLEAFNSDGLRSLIATMLHIPNMKEKTLRYPGHADLMRSLIDAGFLSNEKKIDGTSPLAFNSKILFDQWKLQPGESEFTIMHISIEGEGKQITYHLYDENETAGTKFSSMSRTTGYACTAAAELVAQGMFKSKGVYAPEAVGADEACYHFVLDYMRERNVVYERSEGKV